MVKRGYVGIAFWQPKDKHNVGQVFRNAHAFGADFICVIGERISYSEPSNTTRAERHIPVFRYGNLDDFLAHIPHECTVVPIEVGGQPIDKFSHPERAIYLFGGEDRTLPTIGNNPISIDTAYCLNMAITSGIVLYDRQAKLLSGK